MIEVEFDWKLGAFFYQKTKKERNTGVIARHSLGLPTNAEAIPMRGGEVKMSLWL